MRTFLLFFILAWLAGLVLDQFTTSIIILALVAALATRLTLYSLKLPHAAAVACLVLLGSFYAAHAKPEPVVCDLAATATVTITAPPNIQLERTQYEVTAPDGCLILVNANRFPLYETGNQLMLTGGKFSLVTDMPSELAGYADYLTRRGISATWQYPDITRHNNLTMKQFNPTSLKLRGASNNSLKTAEALSRLRTSIREQIYHLFPEPDASLIAAMLFAERGTIPDDIQENFRRTGTSHVLAISGLHISLIAAMLLGVLLLLPLPPAPRTLLLIALLWSYITFLGQPISAVRAGIFWTIALLALRLRRLVSLPTIILLAATVVLTVNPATLYDVGFQLSFAAVTGIYAALFISQPIIGSVGARVKQIKTSAPSIPAASRRVLAGRNPAFLLEQRRPPAPHYDSAPIHPRRKRRGILGVDPIKTIQQFNNVAIVTSGIHWLTSLTIVSLGASLATLPLISYHFGLVSPINLLANLLIVPTIPAVISLSIAALLASFFPPLALIITAIIHLLVRYLTTTAELLASLPASHVAYTMPLWQLAVYYALIVTIVILIARRQHRSWRELWA